jgi:hypothetical protein
MSAPRSRALFLLLLGLSSLGTASCRPLDTHRAKRFLKQGHQKQERNLLTDALALYREAREKAPPGEIRALAESEIAFTEALRELDGHLTAGDLASAIACEVPGERHLVDYTLETESDLRRGRLLAQRRLEVAELLEEAGEIGAARVVYARVAALDPEGTLGVTTRVTKRDQPKDYGEMSWDELVAKVSPKGSGPAPPVPAPPPFQLVPGSNLPHLSIGLSHLAHARAVLKDVYTTLEVFAAERGRYPEIDDLEDLARVTAEVRGAPLELEVFRSVRTLDRAPRGLKLEFTLTQPRGNVLVMLPGGRIVSREDA